MSDHRQPLRRVESVAVPFPVANVDTDTIFPVGGRVSLERGHHADRAFAALRFDADGRERPDFVMNRPEYRGSSILVTGPNFGCGSSRELAVWAMYDLGFRVAIAPSFGDIFFGNCCTNGLLPVRLSRPEVELLLATLAESPTVVTVDLESCSVATADGWTASFQIDRHRRRLLLDGLDEIADTERSREDIDRFRVAYDQRFPWARLASTTSASSAPQRRITQSEGAT